MTDVSPRLGTDPCRNAEEREQSVDRDHEDILLDALDATDSDQAQDGECAVTGPSSPAARQPRRLLVYTGEVIRVVDPGLRLDRDRDAGRGDRDRVDVSPALPPQRVPQPPPLRHEGGKRVLHLVF